MSGNSGNAYIGKIVSLISTANIRYEGTIYTIDNDRITLKNVRIFGTEDRDCEVFIDRLKDMRSNISFNRSGIKVISIINNYSFFDPSIVSQAQEPNTGVPMAAGEENGDVHTLNAKMEDRPSQHVGVGGMPIEREEPVKNDFDFEESNKQFENDEPMDNVEPAYKKNDFFDSLQANNERGKTSGGRYRSADAETFGKKSLDDRNREYRMKNRGGYQGRGMGYNRRGGNRRGGYQNRFNPETKKEGI